MCQQLTWESAYLAQPRCFWESPVNNAGVFSWCHVFLSFLIGVVLTDTSAHPQKPSNGKLHGAL